MDFIFLIERDRHVGINLSNFHSISNSDNRIGEGLNGTDAPAVVEIRRSDPDVAIFAPSGTPGVTNNVIVRTLCVSAESDTVDNVVHSGATF